MNQTKLTIHFSTFSDNIEAICVIKYQKFQWLYSSSVVIFIAQKYINNKFTYVEIYHHIAIMHKHAYSHISGHHSFMNPQMNMVKPFGNATVLRGIVSQHRYINTILPLWSNTHTLKVRMTKSQTEVVLQTLSINCEAGVSVGDRTNCRQSASFTSTSISCHPPSFFYKYHKS